MIIGQEYVVKIEKLVNQGFGFARIDNIPIFVIDACPNEVVRIKIVSINSNYCKAEIISIIKPSESRIEPLCQLHNMCGSCNWQFINYDEQLKQKSKIVYETIRSIAGLDLEVLPTIPSPKITEYRCKIQMPVAQAKKSKRILSGYYKKNTHELINIKYCLMHPFIINNLSEYIKQEARVLNLSGYDETSHSGLLRHIVYRINSDSKNIIVIFVINSDTIPPELRELSEIISKSYPQIDGICVNFNTEETNVIMGRKTVCITGNSYYIETFGTKKYKITAGSFFQVNPLCAEKILNKVKELISERCSSPAILDAYSGVSTFGIWLSDIAKKVVSVEESKSASQDARDSLKLNNIDNIEIINGDAGKEFANLINNGVKFDVSVIDPPRKGCSVDAIENLVKLTGKYIVYVSCNPATLARDMKILQKYSFKPVYVQPVDMFPNTYHIETIVLLELNKE